MRGEAADVLVGASAFEEAVDRIRASGRYGTVCECLLQLRPGLESVFASERVLHVAQDRFGWAAGICSFKAPAGLRVVFAQGFEPAFGFSSQIVASGS
jgi:hypothetical protein